MGIRSFLKNAFSDMKESAKAQHEVDKASMAAVKAESKAQWEEAKAMGKPETRKSTIQKNRDEQIDKANARRISAESRINVIKNK